MGLGPHPSVLVILQFEPAFQLDIGTTLHTGVEGLPGRFGNRVETFHHPSALAEDVVVPEAPATIRPEFHGIPYAGFEPGAFTAYDADPGYVPQDPPNPYHRAYLVHDIVRSRDVLAHTRYILSVADTRLDLGACIPIGIIGVHWETVVVTAFTASRDDTCDHVTVIAWYTV